MTGLTTPVQTPVATPAPQAGAGRWAAAVPRWLQASLARRLMLGLAVALLVSAAVLVVLALAIGRDGLRRQHEAAAERVARLFEASLQNAMLKRDLDGMAGILTSLGQSPGVAQARLLEPGGTVRFASHTRAVGSAAQAELAGLCLHAGCKPPQPRLDWRPAPGGDQLRIAYPILNQQRCVQCHGTADSRPVNGVLLVDFEPLAPVTPLGGPGLLLTGAGLATLALFAAIMGFTLRRQVAWPLARLAAATDRLAQGELSARVGAPAHGPDELGRVAHGFDDMAARVQTMVGDLAEQHRFLQTLIDAIPDPVLVIAPDHRIRLANSAYGALTGHDVAQLVGQACHRASRGLDEPCPVTLLHCPVAEIRARPQRLRSMMSLRRADGSAVEVDIEAAPLVTRAGETLVVEVMRPLDRAVRFSQEQRLSTIGLLANGVAHEIHNPLASIRLALQASLRGLRAGDMGRDELVDYLQLVDREIDRCVATTQRLMQMSQTPGQTLQPVALRPAVDDVLALLGEECRSRGVQVHIDIEPAAARVMADEAELRQVLVNLIHNALHAMAQGGRIEVQGRPAPASPESPGTDYQLSVRDTGCGIGPDEQTLIFMPFFSQRSDGQRGTGLGLAICKAALERFGGRITVQSSPGAGACFTLHLRTPQAESAGDSA
ncbi:sensor histidine kinase [Ottowia testudinis]|uniref:histidine kinase n=1 Tax=Ottowia testudinis TaxID=2816950 RepID=A0A975H2T6_9BURK|nr:HAMP domain-containing sensor histidine kinase [Ottowia testudinis]QTD45109.1 HAMP domain-containing protein [Ottowia testudinis]